MGDSQMEMGFLAGQRREVGFQIHEFGLGMRSWGDGFLCLVVGGGLALDRKGFHCII